MAISAAIICRCRAWIAIDRSGSRDPSGFLILLHDVHVYYKHTVLWAKWVNLRPMLAIDIFVVVYSRIARLPCGNARDTLFDHARLLLWAPFTSFVAQETQSLQSRRLTARSLNNYIR